MAPDSPNPDSQDDVARLEKLSQAHGLLRSQIGKVIVGNEAIVEGVLACLLAVAWAFAPGPARAGQRVALVIGNGAYEAVPSLSNPRNDAGDIGERGERLTQPLADGAEPQGAGGAVEQGEAKQRSGRGCPGQHQVFDRGLKWQNGFVGVGNQGVKGNRQQLQPEQQGGHMHRIGKHAGSHGCQHQQQVDQQPRDVRAPVLAAPGTAREVRVVLLRDGVDFLGQFEVERLGRAAVVRARFVEHVLDDDVAGGKTDAPHRRAAQVADQFVVAPPTADGPPQAAQSALRKATDRLNDRDSDRNRARVAEAAEALAAIDAAVGLKLHPDFDSALAAMTRVAEVFEPIPRHRDVYQELYDKVYRPDILEHAYRLRRSVGGAPGVDGVRWMDYQEGLLERLEALHDRIHKQGKLSGIAQ